MRKQMNRPGLSSLESWIKQQHERMKKVLHAFLRCLLNNGCRIPSHSTSCFIGWACQSFFFSSAPLKSCPPGSIRVATCHSAVVAMETSPPCHFSTVQSQVHGEVLNIFFWFWQAKLPSYYPAPRLNIVWEAGYPRICIICIHHEPHCWKQFEGQHPCM